MTKIKNIKNQLELVYLLKKKSIYNLKKDCYKNTLTTNIEKLCDLIKFDQELAVIDNRLINLKWQQK